MTNNIAERIEYETLSNIIGKNKNLSYNIVSLDKAINYCENTAPRYVNESMSMLEDLRNKNIITKEEKEFMVDYIFRSTVRFERFCGCSKK